jgi:hypothetical protein
MKLNGLRSRRIQRLAYEMMDEMNLRKEERPTEILTMVIDNLSRHHHGDRHN